MRPKHPNLSDLMERVYPRNGVRSRNDARPFWVSNPGWFPYPSRKDMYFGLPRNKKGMIFNTVRVA